MYKYSTFKKSNAHILQARLLNFKNNFKQCDRLNAKTAIIIGEEEVKNNMVTVKNLKTKEEEKVELMFLVEYLDNILIDECSCGCDECHDDCECKH